MCRGARIVEWPVRDADRRLALENRNGLAKRGGGGGEWPSRSQAWMNIGRNMFRKNRRNVRMAREWLPSVTDPSVCLRTGQQLTALENGTFFAVDVERLRLSASRDGDIIATLELPFAPACLCALPSTDDAVTLILAHGASLSVVHLDPSPSFAIACHLLLPYLAEGPERGVANAVLRGEAPFEALVEEVLGHISTDGGAQLSPSGRLIAALDAHGGDAGRTALCNLHHAVSQVLCIDGDGSAVVVGLADCNVAVVPIDATLYARGTWTDDSPPPDLAASCTTVLSLPNTPQLLRRLELVGTGEASYAVACSDGTFCIIRNGSLHASVSVSLPPRGLAVSEHTVLLVAEVDEQACQLVAFTSGGQRLWTRVLDGPTACVGVSLAKFGADGGEARTGGFAVALPRGVVDLFTLAGGRASRCDVGEDGTLVACRCGLYAKEPNALLAVTAGGTLAVRMLSRCARTRPGGLPPRPTKAIARHARGAHRLLTILPLLPSAPCSAARPRPSPDSPRITARRMSRRISKTQS